MITNKREPFLRFALVGGVLALRVVRFAALAVAFVLAAGMLKYSFGWSYLFVAFLASCASYFLITYLYSRIIRELITAPSLLDETLKTVYFLLAVIPTNWFVFTLLAALSAPQTQKVPEELKDFLMVRFWVGSIALIVLVTFGEIINRVGRHIRARR